MKAYPAELRTRIVAAVDNGMTQTEVARVFAVSERTIRRYLAQHQQTGELTPKRSPGRPPAIGVDQATALRTQVATHPDAILAEHCTIWAREHGAVVSIATMSRAIRRLGITLKKSSVRRRAG